MNFNVLFFIINKTHSIKMFKTKIQFYIVSNAQQLLNIILHGFIFIFPLFMAALKLISLHSHQILTQVNLELYKNNN